MQEERSVSVALCGREFATRQRSSGGLLAGIGLALDGDHVVKAGPAAVTDFAGADRGSAGGTARHSLLDEEQQFGQFSRQFVNLVLVPSLGSAAQFPR